MIFDHKVKFGGVYYPTGADVPVGKTTPIEKTEQPTQTPSDEVAEIQAMTNIMKLRKVARDKGVKFAQNATVPELKKAIIDSL